MGDTPQVNLVKLREILLERAVSDDLRIFCADLRVNYEEVVGPNDKLPVAIINIIKYFDSRDRIGELIARARREFPSTSWSDVLITQTTQKEATDSVALTETAQVTVIPAPRKPGPLRVFLCHASDDKPAVHELYGKLQAAGIQPWLDEEELVPGQKWKVEIPKAIQNSDVILVCLSQKSTKREGYVKREIEFALDNADKLPDDAIFIIPLRLEECDFPERLGDWHGVNLYAPRGYERLMRALQIRASSLGAEPIAPSKEPEQFTSQKTPATNSPLIELPKLGFRLELVRVPAGEFLMGSDKSKDKDAYDAELPQHRVYLDEYLIAKYPVTVAQFAAFVKDANYKTTAEQQGSAYVWDGKEWKDTKGANWQHPRGPKSDVSQKQNHPVTCVSWDDAMAFCKWLSEVSGRAIRLPSEAQWEKAARGVDGRIYPWGDEPPDDKRCNFNMNVKDTTPVGRYSPAGDSPYGCVDMAGNVWEWMCSLWGKDVSKPEFTYPYTHRMDERENVSAGRDYLRVLRGGAFDDLGALVRCAARRRGFPGSRLDNDGFRGCALPIHL